MLNYWRHASLAAGLGLITSLAVLWMGGTTFHLKPGQKSFQRLVAGASPNGLVGQRAIISLPGLKRARSREVRIETEPSSPGASLGISVDRGPIHYLRLHRDGSVLVSILSARGPGARLDLTPGRGEGPLRLTAVGINDEGALPLGVAVIAGVASSVLVFAIAAGKGMALAASLGFLTAFLLGLATSPASWLLAIPDRSSLVRFVPVGLLLFGVFTIVWRLPEAERRFFRQAALILAAIVFGVWVRWFFLPSSGSWDTDIRKAWMLRTVTHGLSRAYGDPGSIPEGQFWAQMRGEEIPWRIPHRGREFVIDYPPLSMLLWKWSWSLVSRIAPELDYGESQNVAVKLPAVAGDVAAVLVLLWTVGARTARGLSMAALYWCLPISWFSSAVLGHHDGALAPLALAAVIAGVGGRASMAGSLLAIAWWTKPLAILVGPALAVALYQRGGSRELGKAAAAAVLVSFFVFLPYLWNGTVDTMVVHVYRIFAPGNLSSGYANPWWFLGQTISVASGEGTWGSRVPFVPLSRIDLPLAAIGASLVVLTTLAACVLQLRSPARDAALLSAATAFFSYSMLGLGVFENHPHVLFLLLLGTGLSSGRLRLFFTLTATTYVLNLALFAGLGRFYGLRFWILEEWASWASGMRMALGFDLTLVLVVINTVGFAMWLVWLPREMRSPLSIR